MARGFFIVDRSLLEHPLWLSDKFTQGQAFIDMIGLARFEAGKVCLKGIWVDLKRGQLAWSEVSLSERWKWSRGRVRRVLKRWESEQRIVQRKSNITTVITILNYDHYQRGGTADGTPDRTANETAGGTPDGTRKNNGNNLTMKTTSPKPPPSPAPATDVWEEVAADLQARGVASAGAAVREAQRVGIAREDIAELLAEFDRADGAYQAGALYRRVTGELTDWPTPDPEHAKQQEREDADRRYQEQIAKSREAQQQSLKERAQIQDDERRYGPKVNAMSDDERTALLCAAIPDPDERHMMGRNMKREAMIAHLKARNGQSRLVEI